MELASRAAIPEPPIAVIGQLSENSRLGFGPAESTLFQGAMPVKYLNGVRDSTSVASNSWQMSLKAQQQSSGGGGFWHHVGNLLHGHSWNYDGSSVTTSFTAPTLHVTTSVQHGFMQVDNTGQVSAVVPPAVAANVTLNVNGAGPNQTLEATPAVGAGKFVQFGTDIVKDANGSVHPQGGSVSFGLSWPPSPGSVAVPMERFTPSSQEPANPGYGAAWDLPSPL